MRKVVLITGGSRGIGKSIVEKFASNGYDVCFSFNKSEELSNNLAKDLSAKYSVKIIPHKTNVSSVQEIRDLVEFTIKNFGHIDVLVNNAGISESKLLIDMTDDELYNMINTNLNSCIFTTREVLKFMLSEHSGKIVNISSMWGEKGAALESVYSASKAGIIGFTKAIAKEVGLSNITVNAVAPGCIETDMLKQYTKEDIQEMAEGSILGRIGTPEDIANTVYFLASDEASFITAQCITVDGGFLQ